MVCDIHLHETGLVPGVSVAGARTETLPPGHCWGQGTLSPGCCTLCSDSAARMLCSYCSTARQYKSRVFRGCSIPPGSHQAPPSHPLLPATADTSSPLWQEAGSTSHCTVPMGADHTALLYSCNCAMDDVSLYCTWCTVLLYCSMHDVHLYCT